MVASITKKRIQGFTLVEMILYVGICSLLLLSISLIFGEVVAARIKSQAINEVNQQGFFLMHTLTSSIRNARTIDTPSMSTGSSSLSITPQNSLLAPTHFFVSSTTFFTQEGSGVPIALTNQRVTVSSLLFENISSSSSTDKVIKIRYTLTYYSLSSKSEYSYTKTFNGSATLRQ